MNGRDQFIMSPTMLFGAQKRRVHQSELCLTIKGHMLNEYWFKGPDLLNNLFGVVQ